MKQCIIILNAIKSFALKYKTISFNGFEVVSFKYEIISFV